MYFVRKDDCKYDDHGNDDYYDDDEVAHASGYMQDDD